MTSMTKSRWSRRSRKEHKFKERKSEKRVRLPLLERRPIAEKERNKKRSAEAERERCKRN